MSRCAASVWNLIQNNANPVDLEVNPPMINCLTRQEVPRKWLVYSEASVKQIRRMYRDARIFFHELHLGLTVGRDDRTRIPRGLELRGITRKEHQQEPPTKHRSWLLFRI